MNIDIPVSIKEAFSDLELPKWLRDIFSLDEKAKFRDIPPKFEINSLAELQAINHYLQVLFTRRITNLDLKDKYCFPHSNLVLDFEILNSFQLSIRTQNALSFFLREHDNKYEINKLTFGELNRIPNMGAKSILEFLITIEKFIFNHNDITDKANDNNSKEDKIFSDNLNDEIKKLISNLESVDNIDQIYRGDPRFISLNSILPLENYEVSGTLFDLLFFSNNEYIHWSISEREKFRILLIEVNQVIQKLNQVPLEEQMKNFIKIYYKNAKDDKLQAMYNRFGINEIGILTLEECGKQVGITRERIRQIESKIYNGFCTIPGTEPIYFPKLDRAVDIIRNNIGSSTKLIQKLFVTEDICNIELSVSAILIFSDLMRRLNRDLRIEKINDGVSIVIGENINVNKILTEANKLYSRNGITDINLLIDTFNVNTESNKINEIVNILDQSGKWKKLEADGRWWVPANIKDVARNRLINVADKILSVCNPIDVDDLRSGFSRLATYRNSSNTHYRANQITVPSKKAIINFFDYVDGYSVNDNLIKSEKNLDYKKVLSSVEKGIVGNLLTSQTGLMTRQEIMRNCMKNGLNEVSVSMYLTYSPIVQHIGLDTHKIIGKNISASNYSAHQKSIAEKIQQKRLLLCDWHEGMIRFVIRCPEFSSNLVVGCPGAYKKMLANKKFMAINELDNQECGNIGINNVGTIYGMGTYCNKAGLEENDIFIMKFNLLKHTAYLSLGNIDDYLDMLD